MKIIRSIIVASVLVAATVLIHPQTILADATTKTFQDFGLGFKIEYPSNLVLKKNPDNLTLSNPVLFNNVSSYVGSVFNSSMGVMTWTKAIGLSGMFTPPNLDALTRNVALALTDSNVTVTNKTKLTIDNTSASLIQAVRPTHGYTVHESTYLILKGDLAYILTFTYLDKAKFQPVEQKIVKSFKFI